MLSIKDIEVGGVLTQLIASQNAKIAFKIIDIDDESEIIKDEIIWKTKGYDDMRVGIKFETNFHHYESRYLNDSNGKYYPPGKWYSPNKDFDEHRERLINA